MPTARTSTKPRHIALSAAQHTQLLRLASPDSSDESIRLRARIVLSWASGATGEQSAALLETSRRTVSKWRSRFRTGGIAALWDRPRPGAPRTIPSGKIAEVLHLRQTPPPQGKPRWTTRLLAQHTGLSQSTVVRISRSHTPRAVSAHPSSTLPSSAPPSSVPNSTLPNSTPPSSTPPSSALPSSPLPAPGHPAHAPSAIRSSAHASE